MMPGSVPTEVRQQRLSIVVPLFNEADNVRPLVQKTHEALAAIAMPWEFVLVNDGSSDATAATLAQVAREHGRHVRIIEMARNYHQTAAMQAGIDAARGDIIVTLDGDLQNDPADIPAMIDRLQGEDLDLVVGWRKQRQEDFWTRILPSRMANALIGWSTGLRLHDYGCSLKAFRTDVIRNVRLYGEMHRFIPAWIASVTTPSRIAQMEVRDHKRLHGRTHYGLSRTFRVLLDLIFVWFFLRYRTRPGHLFGGLGLVLGGVSIAILGYLLFVKFGQGQPIGSRPLLLVGIMLGVGALQAILLGLIAELLTRIYYESGMTRTYVTHRSIPLDDEEGWHQQEPASRGETLVS